MINFQPNFNTDEKPFGDMLEYGAYESIRLFGYPCTFVSAEAITDNKIFGEQTARNFLIANGHPMFFNDTEDTVYGGTELFGGFGMTPNYNKKIYIAIKEFKDIDKVPLEGDLIFDNNYDIIFEITKVDTLTEQNIGKLNNRQFTYSIYLKHYQFDYDDNIENLSEFDADMEDFTLEDLSLTNSEVTTDVNNLGIIDSTRTNPFGTLD